MNILNIPIGICFQCNKPFENSIDGIRCGCTKKKEWEQTLDGIRWILNDWIEREIKSMRKYKDMWR